MSLKNVVFFIFLLCLVIFAELFDALSTLRHFEGVLCVDLDDGREEEEDDEVAAKVRGVVVADDAREVDTKSDVVTKYLGEAITEEVDP